MLQCCCGCLDYHNNINSDTAWSQRHIGVNNLPKAITQLCPSGKWTHDPMIGSPIPYRYATAHLVPLLPMKSPFAAFSATPDGHTKKVLICYCKIYSKSAVFLISVSFPHLYSYAQSFSTSHHVYEFICRHCRKTNIKITSNVNANLEFIEHIIANASNLLQSHSDTHFGMEETRMTHLSDLAWVAASSSWVMTIRRSPSSCWRSLLVRST